MTDIHPKQVNVPGHAVTPVATGKALRHDTVDGLPPRYEGGNLTPVNSKDNFKGEEIVDFREAEREKLRAMFRKSEEEKVKVTSDEIEKDREKSRVKAIEDEKAREKARLENAKVKL